MCKSVYLMFYRYESKRLTYFQRFKNLESRFWEKVAIDDPDKCWLWKTGCFPAGYGQFWLDGISRCAHRVAWYLTYGVWPSEHLLHECDNPPCVNVRHLRDGSPKDNAIDRQNKGRGNTPIGEYCGRSKLKEAQVLEIRRSADKGISHTAIARNYGIDRMIVTLIAKRVNWKHLKEET